MDWGRLEKVDTNLLACKAYKEVPIGKNPEAVLHPGI
jgi:hypothetical protein